MCPSRPAKSPLSGQPWPRTRCAVLRNAGDRPLRQAQCTALGARVKPCEACLRTPVLRLASRLPITAAAFHSRRRRHRRRHSRQRQTPPWTLLWSESAASLAACPATTRSALPRALRLASHCAGCSRRRGNRRARTPRHPLGECTVREGAAGRTRTRHP